MRVNYRVIKTRDLWQVGDLLTLDHSIGDLYAQRGFLERVPDTTYDIDGDGRDEGGPDGDNKALTQPPAVTRQPRRERRR